MCMMYISRYMYESLCLCVCVCVCVSQYVHILNIQTVLNNLLYHYTTDLLEPANTTKR